jgi:hypothetical protein
MILIKIFNFIKNFIIEHPTLVKGWIVNFVKDVKRSPILTGLLLFILYKLGDVFFIHQNAEHISNHKREQIKKEINLSLNECGNGSTISRISIGTVYRRDDATSFLFDIVRSCDKHLSGIRDNKTCDLDVKWLNPAWRQSEDLDSKTMKLLNSDTINLGGSYNFVFKDGQPIWLNLFKEEGVPTRQAEVIKVIAPKLFEILNSSKRTISQIGVVKVRHPTFHNIVYLFTLSFWHNDYGEPEMKCNFNKDKILRNLAKKQKQLLQ